MQVINYYCASCNTYEGTKFYATDRVEQLDSQGTCYSCARKIWVDMGYKMGLEKIATETEEFPSEFEVFWARSKEVNNE